jgi:hypothetical protein
MDISPAARRVIFGLTVCALVGLGLYLIGPAALGAGGGSSRNHGSPPTTTAARQTSGTPSSASSGQPDIYQWLPFTSTELAAAAAVVVKFGDAYGSYSYTEDAAAYSAPMAPITSTQLVGQIEAAYTAPGVAAARVSGKQVAAGTASIDSIRAFGAGSLTFLVQLSQQLTDKTGRSQQSAVYAITVTGSGATWQVTDVELASAGNS